MNGVSGISSQPAKLKFANSKPHYEILDGLRGVAAIMVVIFHVFETHTGGDHLIQVINHGYLAVDFFFLLSGFVIAYAYDDRWGRMSRRDFMKRRLIRLQPMIVLGSVVGAALFYFGKSEVFPPIAQTSLWQLLAVMVVGCTLLPLPPSLDVRGWEEMHPLNGPAWTLFYEYIANAVYALFLRRVSRWLLAALVALAGVALFHHATTNPQGDMVGGWSITANQLKIGFTRLCYPFLAGMLLFRVGKLRYVGHAFWICSAILIVMLSAPRFGGAERRWLNGLYEALCISLVFPAVVWMGAGGQLTSGFSKRVCNLLGGISYPLYITHYPLIYVYTAWVVNGKRSIQDAWPQAVALVVGSVVLAYLYWRFYDVPVRAWLQRGNKTRAGA